MFNQGEFAVELRFSFNISSVITGLVIGLSIALVTVLLTAIWTSRLNVIRAIRDLPDPLKAQQRLRVLLGGALAAAVGGVITAVAAGSVNANFLMVGPALVAFGLIPLAGRLLPRRAVVSALSSGLLAWGAWVIYQVAPDALDKSGISFFVVQGVILVAAAVVLLSANQDIIGNVVRTMCGSKSVSARIGLAYPLARRFRTGLILAMYSLVVFTLTFITMLSYLFGSQVDTTVKKVSSGYDLSVKSNRANPVSIDALTKRSDIKSVLTLSTLQPQYKVPGDTKFRDWFVSGISAPLRATVTKRAPQYKSSDAAMRAVIADPLLIIIDDSFLQRGGGPPSSGAKIGDKIIMRDRISGRSKTLTVIGIAQNQAQGIISSYISQATAHEVFQSLATPNVAYVKVAGNASAADVARALNKDFQLNGADARTFRSQVQESQAASTQFFQLIQGYLALGLVIGIAGLGVVMIRAVRERRREIGMLRAIGFVAPAVRRAFLVESAFIVVEALTIGVGLAMLTVYRITNTNNFGDSFKFTVPWTQLALITGITLVASLLATAAPAQQASRIKPAVALRLTD